MRWDRSYIVKWWITTVVFLAPLITLIASSVGGGEFAIAFLTIPMGLAFSFPVMLMAYLLFLFMETKNISALLAKCILNAVVVAGIIITFYLVSGSMADWLTVMYAGSAIISSMFFKISEQSEND